MATLAFLPLLLANWTRLDDDIPRFLDTAEAAEPAGDASDQAAARDMDVGRFYISRTDYIAAINRFRIVVTQYQTSPYVEEALAHLAESYRGLLSQDHSENRESIASEAQTAVAVLDRKFPTSHWSAEAHDRLSSVGLEPVENEKSWISKTFK